MDSQNQKQESLEQLSKTQAYLRSILFKSRLTTLLVLVLAAILFVAETMWLRVPAIFLLVLLLTLQANNTFVLIEWLEGLEIRNTLISHLMKIPKEQEHSEYKLKT